jgi:hypothetical protein|tara:strand:- start:262 stop:396 length:135 start_codon:yes stop_codon:yes gene_type:complete
MKEELHDVINLLARLEHDIEECRDRINKIIDKLALEENNNGTDK